MDSIRKLTRVSVFIFALLIIGSSPTNAQLSEGGKPYSFTSPIPGVIETKQMPSIDIPTLLAEDRAELSKGVPFRFGFPHSVDYSVTEQGTVTSLPDGSTIYRLRITAPGATSLNFVYSFYKIPRGAKFYIYNQSKTFLIGAFTHRNNKDDNLFATGIVPAEDVILEYYEPASVEFKGKIVLQNIVQGYKNIFKDYPLWDDFGTSGACNNNVNCPEGDPWKNETRAAAIIITSSGSRLCSGSMINNVNVDLMPYFLTANHCIAASAPNTWVFMFNYQSPTCANIDGPLTYTLSGSQLKAKSADSDFGLLLLNEAPPDTFRLHWAGWSRVDSADTKSVGIHHPDGDIKKISFDNDPNSSADYEPAPYLANSHWKITSWDDGTTEGGSSGSPLYNQNHHIVGQLHGGWASCSDFRGDYYGKFSMSWERGSTPATRLRDWLDPNNTGVWTLDGYDPTIGNPDTVAPTRISNLHVVSSTTNSVELNWTAPSDSSFGGVKKYDIRYSTSPIPDTTAFGAATPVVFTRNPAPAGTPEVFSVLGLAVRTKYYFAIRSSDYWKNVSQLSNVVFDTTLYAPLLLVQPDSIKRILNSNETIKDTIWIRNNNTLPSTLTYSVELKNNTFPNGMADMSLYPVSEINAGKFDLHKEQSISETINGGQSFDGSGGPDGGGYKWIDSDAPNGPVYVWNDISSTGTQVTNWIVSGTGTALDDGYAGPFPIGFPFKFYGESKANAYISTNGQILFAPLTVSGYSNTTIPTAAVPNDFIAPFWDDLDGRTQGTVHYKAEPGKFIIQYTNWQKFSASGSLTFQVELYPSGKVMIYYNNMSGTLNSATVGLENSAGTIGTQVAYNAAYVKNNLALKISSDPDWVNATNLTGTITQGNSTALQLTLTSADYPSGQYSMDVVITTNDPLHTTKTIPVKMLLNGGIPVELSAFSADVKGSDVQLNWSTATETNNLGFMVERRTLNSTNWAELGLVKGKGTTTEKSIYSFIDSKTSTGKYVYRLKQIDFDGKFKYTPNVEVDVQLPKDFSLSQNYPNPFNPSTVITYSLPEKANVSITVFNMLGEQVGLLVSKQQEAGYYKLDFDASKLSSGTYIYSLRAIGESRVFTSSKKMLFLK